MTILKMFEHVSIMAPIEQRLFINYYNETVDELCGLYDKYVLKNETADPESVHIQNITDEEGGILPLYHTAMIDNIYQYISTDASEKAFYKQEFLRKASMAHNRYFRDDSKKIYLKKAWWW